MFQQFLAGIRGEITNMIFKIRVQTPEQANSENQSRLTQAAEKGVESGVDGARVMKKEAKAQADKNKTVIKKNKVGRNDPCPCGAIDQNTGKPKKYKKCCGRNS